MGRDTQLFEKLQKEFCPPLDSALIAALLSDFGSSGPTESQSRELWANLRSLATQAAADESLPEGEDGKLCTNEYEHSENSSVDTAGIFNGGCDSSSHMTVSSDTSVSPTDPYSPSPQEYAFTTPVGFLQAILPGVSTQVIRKALDDAGVPEDQDMQIDLWDVIAHILTAEYIREMQERGLEGLDEEENSNPVDDWTIVGPNGKSKKTKTAPPRRAKSTVTKIISFGDVRQQRPAKRSNSVTIGTSFSPWTQISSICSHLSTLVPSRDASFFAPYFHSPAYGTPYEALCTALSATCTGGLITDSEEKITSQTLLEVLLPSYPDLDSEQHDHLLRDIQLSIQATGGIADDALDLVKLLRELDDDYGRGDGDRGMGVYHLPLATPTSPPISAEQPTFPPPVPPPLVGHSSTLQPNAKPDPFAWKTVAVRNIPQPHRLALSIPAYSSSNSSGKAKCRSPGVNRGSGIAIAKGGKGDTGVLSGASNLMQRQYMHKRDELLRQAAKMWQKGNVRTRGGEVAQYYADRARAFQELAKKEALNAARDAVETKRLSTPKQDTVDLHGTTIAEAIAIVRETLLWYGTSPAKPLRIITGRGKHSVNQVGVLKPAIRKELQQEGWDVRAWEGGLVVQGKK